MRREPNMRPQVLFVVVATLAVFAALPLAQSKGQAKKASATPWPCCDNCSMCTRSLPPQCRCADTAPRGCHPACKHCEKSSRRGGDGALVYKCKDVITDYCKQRCTPAA